jgi:8-oxo-dGTP pyrophosphatase MutT (NUDIX family)
MDPKSSNENESSGVELAAGGLVWRHDSRGLLLAVVHRGEHVDWTLPKGRREKGENLRDTAVREAMEETGSVAVVREFAGAYSYRKNELAKTVLMWHMHYLSDPYANPATREEVTEVAWLPPGDALNRLSHSSEKDFLAGHLSGPGYQAPQAPILSGSCKPQLQRLAVALQSVQKRLNGLHQRMPQDSGAWWFDSARHSLEVAETALLRGDRDSGWGALHDAERLIVFGMSNAELLARAATLREETRAKLKGWRASATARLFASVALADWVKPPYSLKVNEHDLLQQVVVQALAVLHEESDNRYHRLRLVSEQLQFLVGASAILLTAVLGFSFWLAGPDSPFRIGCLGPVALAGALGGVISAMFQLSRVGEARIPDALMHGLITSGRPLVGAACALFLYAALLSNVISLIDVSKMTFATALVMGFAAGFSEKLVLRTVSRVSGDTKDSEPNVVSPRVIVNPSDKYPTVDRDTPADETKASPPLAKADDE